MQTPQIPQSQIRHSPETLLRPPPPSIRPPRLSPLTRALAVLHVGLQLPTLVAGTFHAELVLLAALAALEVFGAEALDLTGLVVGPQLHA